MVQRDILLLKLPVFYLKWIFLNCFLKFEISDTQIIHQLKNYFFMKIVGSWFTHFRIFVCFTETSFHN